MADPWAVKATAPVRPPVAAPPGDPWGVKQAPAPPNNDPWAVAQPEQPQQDQGSVAGRLVDSFVDIPRETLKQSGEAMQALKRDFTEPLERREPDAVTGEQRDQQTKDAPLADWAIPKRALRIGADLLGAVEAPFKGAVTSIVGRPMEAVTGIPKEKAGEGAAIIAETAYPMRAAVKALSAPTERVFSPTTMSAESRQTERTIRRQTGMGDLDTERAAEALKPYSALVGNLPVAEQRALVDYIENRSAGHTIADPRLQGAADAIRDTYEGVRTKMQNVLDPNDLPGFITDYYSHLWKEQPQNVVDTMNAFYSKQGSSRSLKARVLPTIQDGLAAGLTPRLENPIENTMTYVRNMNRYLGTYQIQQELDALGYSKWLTPGKQPRGWVELEGIRTNKSAPTGQGGAVPLKLYAPEDVARVYNNFISKGLEQGDWQPFWAAARAVANGFTMMKLGLSTFHGNTMVQEGIVSDFARAAKAASTGDFGTAGRALARAPTSPVTTYRAGEKMAKELLQSATPSAISQTVNDAYVRAGGRLRMDPFYRTRASGSFWQAMERGTFKRELGEAVRRTYQGSAMERAKGTVDLAANLLQTTAAPLFEKYIPAMKRGAFSKQMEDFMRANPMATQRQIDDYAINLVDTIDNRFGEMIQDNVFWGRSMKQIAQILLLSPSWNLGTVREIGGGLTDIAGTAKDIAKGQYKGITDRTAYVAALAAVTALENGMMTYLKTGSKPEGRDFMAYRTGGTVPGSDEPERGMLPGYQKDVYAFGTDFPFHIKEEIENKANPGLVAVRNLINNKDYRGLDLMRPHGVDPIEGEPSRMDAVIDAVMPISIGQLLRARKEGSNISKTEGFLLSTRPAPGYVQDPQKAEEDRLKYARKDWKARVRADQRAKSKEEQPSADPWGVK